METLTFSPLLLNPEDVGEIFGSSVFFDSTFKLKSGESTYIFGMQEAPGTFKIGDLFGLATSEDLLRYANLRFSNIKSLGTQEYQSIYSKEDET